MKKTKNVGFGLGAFEDPPDYITKLSYKADEFIAFKKLNLTPPNHQRNFYLDFDRDSDERFKIKNIIEQSVSLLESTSSSSGTSDEAAAESSAQDDDVSVESMPSLGSEPAQLSSEQLDEQSRMPISERFSNLYNQSKLPFFVRSVTMKEQSLGNKKHDVKNFLFENFATGTNLNRTNEAAFASLKKYLIAEQEVHFKPFSFASSDDASAIHVRNGAVGIFCSTKCKYSVS